MMMEEMNQKEEGKLKRKASVEYYPTEERLTEAEQEENDAVTLMVAKARAEMIKRMVDSYDTKCTKTPMQMIPVYK
jgi:hypothetical protein